MADTRGRIKKLEQSSTDAGDYQDAWRVVMDWTPSGQSSTDTRPGWLIIWTPDDEVRRIWQDEQTRD